MRVYLLLWVMVLITACGQLSTKNSSLISQTSNETIPFRFVVGGWIVPQNYNPEDDPFANELQTTVIRNNNELRQFLGNIEILRLRGSIETLHMTNFDTQLVMASYYRWLPIKGDPLSIEAITLEDLTLVTRMKLSTTPEGKEFPYLAAPLAIISMDRTNMPETESLRFQFMLDSH